MCRRIEMFRGSSGTEQKDLSVLFGFRKKRKANDDETEDVTQIQPVVSVCD